MKRFSDGETFRFGQEPFSFIYFFLSSELIAFLQSSHRLISRYSTLTEDSQTTASVQGAIELHLRQVMERIIAWSGIFFFFFFFFFFVHTLPTNALNGYIVQCDVDLDSKTTTSRSKIVVCSKLVRIIVLPHTAPHLRSQSRPRRTRKKIFISIYAPNFQKLALKASPHLDESIPEVNCRL